MTDAPAATGAGRHPVLYAGRFVDQVAGAGLPGECVVLGEQDALPHTLAGVLDRATTLVFIDLPTFPLETMSDDHWDLPLVAVLPSGSDAGSLISTFGSVLFERLDSFDRIVVPDYDLWEALRQKYRWARSQLIPVTGEDPGDVARTVCASLTREQSSALGGAGPRSDKALRRVQATALAAHFAAARGKEETGAPLDLDVLEVGAGAGRWVSSFDPANTRYVGIDAREELVEAARADFPEERFDLLGSNLSFPYEAERFDLVFGVAVMHHHPTPARRTLLSEMWRVTRPGGRLSLLENFVSLGEPGIYPMSVAEFVDLILDATAGQVVLEHVESLRYPGEGLRRGGLISLLRLGVPRTQ